MTVAGRDCTQREGLPDAAGGRLDGILAGPILNEVVSSVRFAPRDANAVDGLRLRQIEDDPLRMQRIAFGGEVLSEIGIALPESVEVAIGEARESGVFRPVIAGETAAGKRISVGVAQAFGGHGSAREITPAGGIAAVPTIAPCSFRIPVPGFDRQFGILAERHWLPAGRLRNLQRVRKQIFVDSLGGNAINAGTQSFTGHKVIGGVRDVNGNGLSGGEKSEDRDDGDNESRNFHANASRGPKQSAGIKTIQLYGFCGSWTSSFLGCAEKSSRSPRSKWADRCLLLE